MHLKTFNAPNMQAALRLIKRDLGSEAVILSTKKKRQEDGAFGLEITAAVEHAATAPALAESTFVKPVLDAQAIDLAGILSQHGLPDIQQEPFLKAAKGVETAGFNTRDAFEMVLNKRGNLAAFGQQFAGDAAHIFVGPHGAGKTTLICKLALHMKNRKPVLYSFDSEKLGGFEPLKVVGEILNRPAHLLEDGQPISDGLVLIDTTGLNPYHGLEIQNLVGMLGRIGRNVHVHIVLPATLNGADMPAIPYAYRALKPQSLVFTRLDECHRYGAMLNTMLNHPMLMAGTVTKSADPAHAPVQLDSASFAKLLTTAPTPLWQREDS